MSEEKYYVCCEKCLQYMPIKHPDAVYWSADHGKKCKEWGQLKKEWGQPKEDAVRVSGTEKNRWAFVWKRPESAIFYVDETPEGYSCAVGPMEELAYSVPRQDSKIT
jgi:hypothetical protein